MVSTKDVLDRHLKHFGEGDISGIVVYSPSRMRAYDLRRCRLGDSTDTM